MWRLEIVSAGEQVLEQDDVSLKSSSFPTRYEGESLFVPGFTVCGPDGKPIESIGGVNRQERLIELGEAGTVCISGLWLNFDEATSQHRFGLTDGIRGFVPAEELDEQLNDSRLMREWNLRFLIADGQELLDKGLAAGYAGTD